MSILVENRFGNLGIVSRISNVLLAKVITIAIAYGGITFGAFVSSGWFLFPVFVAVYLLFTGLTGWAPTIALDNYFKRVGTTHAVA